MIKITKFSKLINECLDIKQNQLHQLKKYRIDVRLNFSIDVSIVSDDIRNHDAKYYRDSITTFLSDLKRSYEYNGIVPKDAQTDLIIKLIKNDDLNDLNIDNYDIDFRVYSTDDYEDDAALKSFFDDNGSKIYYGPRIRLNSYFNEIQKEHRLKTKTPIVTFYSYKGGMGRTTTMISYALDLALNYGKKVFIIDCDLEAPGYLNFFKLHDDNALKKGNINGFVEFLSDIKFMKKPSDIKLDKYVINIGNQYREEGLDTDTIRGLQNIYLMPAGNLNENDVDGSRSENRDSYLEGLSRINISNESTIVEGFRLLIQKIEEVDSIQPDIILVDSRTGFNDIIGTSTMYLSDIVVGFFGSSEQTIPGLLRLLDSYVKNNYSLTIVSSIMSYVDRDEAYEREKSRVLQYINLITDEDTPQMDAPAFFKLRRRKELEMLGTDSVEKGDANYISFVKDGKFDDYNELFGFLNQTIQSRYNISIYKKVNDSIDQQEGIENEFCLSSLDLRNIILKHLKVEMKRITPFAENMEINENTFFFRNCMNDFFDEKMFIIRGYKGTGKTYIYKALADPNLEGIAKRMKERANSNRIAHGQQPMPDCRLKFIDIISYDVDGKKSFPFKVIPLSTIKDVNYYFYSFWQIHTWISVFQEEEFKDILEESKLKFQLIEMHNDTKSIEIFDSMISSGYKTLLEIENDFDRLNVYLSRNNIKLFLLYDQLDTKIDPKNWHIEVSPLVDWWRERWNRYSNILPKIFIRTDLFQRIFGTNTARLDVNIIDIEWSIEEVFSYLFKLVFSDNASQDAFWDIAKHKVHASEEWMKQVKKDLKEDYNQIELLQSVLGYAVSIFFGKMGKNKDGYYTGSAWDYFKQNLSNADNSISLRPFITTLNDNAINEALVKIVDRYVTEIIPATVYASRDVRVKAANSYFDDLAKDEFSHDLLHIRDFINTDIGMAYRYKSLNETDFTGFLNGVLSSSSYETELKTVDELKTLLKANGIVSENITRNGKFYRFATMYAYAWGLKSKTDDESQYKKQYVKSKNIRSNKSLNLIEGVVKSDGKENYCEVTIGYYKGNKFSISKSYKEGATVTFLKSDVKLNQKYPKESNYKKFITKTQQ